MPRLDNLTEAQKVVEWIKSQKYDPKEWGWWLYAVQAGEFVKIGVARNVGRRINEMQTGNPYEITLVRAWYCNEIFLAYRAEAIAHRQFREHHMRGEWFRLPALEIERLRNTRHIYPFHTPDLFTKPSPEFTANWTHRFLTEGMDKTLALPS